VPIYPGQPIIPQVLIDKEQIQETHSNAALLLEKGMVAKAMPISLVTGVADALQPGDRVDIIATFRAQSTTAASAVATNRTLADVLILQVGPWPPPNTKTQPAASASVITFQLKEQDALALQYIMEYAASVSLVLRAANDHEILQLEPVTFDYINQRFGFRLPR
jgi:Flp pilus assembly protein CpaB